MVIYIENEKKVTELVEFYRECIEIRCGKKPPYPESDDINILRWLVNEYPKDRECKGIIAQYLGLPDEWLKNQGFPLRLIKKHINAAIMNVDGVDKSNKQIYALNYSTDGKPICSYEKKKIGKFNPVLWDEWLKGSIADKLQLPKESWEAAGNNVDEWLKMWKEEGFLGSNITHNPTGKIPNKVKNSIKKQKDYKPNLELARLCTQIISDCASGRMTKEQHIDAMKLVDVIVERKV